MNSKIRARRMLENVVFLICVGVALGAFWYYVGCAILHAIGLK